MRTLRFRGHQFQPPSPHLFAARVILSRSRICPNPSSTLNNAEADAIPPYVNALLPISERVLGDTEASYFLPSRQDGVNDMYLHLGFHARRELIDRERVKLVWAIMRIRHPLLASRVVMHDYNDIRFVYTAPQSIKHALDDSNTNLEYRTQNKDELLDSYLNGPRTLSNDRLSYLIVSTDNMPVQDSDTSAEAALINCDILICATHFIGDGMALHLFSNDFFGLLGGVCTMNELSEMVTTEWRSRWEEDRTDDTLPSSLEARLPRATGKLQEIAYRVDFNRSQEKLIGGHSFIRRPGATRRTVVPTVSIDPERTKQLLKNCKAHGVSISSALFALCNIAWIKTSGQGWELPTMMYSALNLRPYLIPKDNLNPSYWFLAVGYFNVVLPAFLPRSSDLSATFWHRARSAKAQSTDAAKNPMTVSRTREMARVRGERSRAWARIDDDKERAVWKTYPAPAVAAPKGPPSDALIGLSLLGNLDGMYKHDTFPSIRLHTLTTGPRQRPGGMLLFGYTFVGKLWLSLGYDENGFGQDVVERFWKNLLSCTDELLFT